MPTRTSSPARKVIASHISTRLRRACFPPAGFLPEEPPRPPGERFAAADVARPPDEALLRLPLTGHSLPSGQVGAHWPAPRLRGCWGPELRHGRAEWRFAHDISMR